MLTTQKKGTLQPPTKVALQLIKGINILARHFKDYGRVSDAAKLAFLDRITRTIRTAHC